MSIIKSLEEEGFYKSEYFSVFSREIQINFPLNYHNKSVLHGSDHWYRVAFLTAVLSWKFSLNEIDFSILLNAGKYHDIGRKSDGRDTMHGYESVNIIRNVILILVLCILFCLFLG